MPDLPSRWSILEANSLATKGWEGASGVPLAESSTSHIGTGLLMTTIKLSLIFSESKDLAPHANR